MRPGQAFSGFGLLVWSVLALACSGNEPFEGPADHVVFISLDTTRPDRLGLYGNPVVKTPNLDRLAAEGIILSDFMTVVPTTLASHVSLFTGKYPQSHGTPRNGFMVNKRNVMLAEVLKQHGFTTAGFAGSFALESRFDFAQGFDHYDETFERFAGEHRLQQNERSAASVTDAVLGYLDREGTPRNLFLFAHYFDAHAPYEPPPPYDTMYDPRGREDLPSWVEVRQLVDEEPETSTELAWRTAAQYAGEISYMDEHLGRLFDELRERGILDRALVVVTSDHGENMWDHPTFFGHGWSTYDSTMRAVGIVRLPGGDRAGTRVNHLVASIDLLPTVLDYLGIPLPEGIDGEVAELTPGAADPDRTRFGQATKPWKKVETDPRWTNMAKARCIRQGSYKFIQVPYTGREELYDVERDPSEQEDLLRAGATEIAAPLRTALEAWAASADPLRSRFENSQRQETIDRLEALGYLGGE